MTPESFFFFERLLPESANNVFILAAANCFQQEATSSPTLPCGPITSLGLPEVTVCLSIYTIKIENNRKCFFTQTGSVVPLTLDSSVRIKWDGRGGDKPRVETCFYQNLINFFTAYPPVLYLTLSVCSHSNLGLSSIKPTRTRTLSAMRACTPW